MHECDEKNKCKMTLKLSQAISLVISEIYKSGNHWIFISWINPNDRPTSAPKPAIPA